ncbi:MAG: ATP-binding protein [Desulfobacteraceae bacterium]|nr:ATP-binding protein [Desulfobacteraceae bacterium]MCB9494034.1 ATP-binding protein [Desulfobacteraceae bacterium]
MSKTHFFNFSREENKIIITMDSRLENIDKAALITKNFLSEKELEELSFSTCLVLREALTNAVRHANKYDLSKKIFYLVQVNQNEIKITIEDQGNGFDWRKALKKKHPNTSDHGRGFEIMKTYFTSVEFNEKGTIISLTKKF